MQNVLSLASTVIYYVLGAIIVSLLTLSGYQWFRIGGLESDLVAAKTAIATHELNAVKAAAVIETLEGSLDDYKTTVEALEKKRDEAKADAEAEKVKRQATIDKIKSEFTETHEQVRLKLIRHATN